MQDVGLIRWGMNKSKDWWGKWSVSCRRTRVAWCKRPQWCKGVRWRVFFCSDISRILALQVLKVPNNEGQGSQAPKVSGCQPPVCRKTCTYIQGHRMRRVTVSSLSREEKKSCPYTWCLTFKFHAPSKTWWKPRTFPLTPLDGKLSTSHTLKSIMLTVTWL